MEMLVEVFGLHFPTSISKVYLQWLSKIRQNLKSKTIVRSKQLKTLNEFKKKKYKQNAGAQQTFCKTIIASLER